MQHVSTVKKGKSGMQAVVLARVSTKEQEEGHSLSAQLNRLHDYCNRRGLDIIQEFTIVESSTRGERPEFQKLIAFIKKQPHKVALVCDKVDRLQRSFREVPTLENLRKSDKLVLHFISENQILDSNANNSQIMAYQIFVMMAENYTNCISDNVKRSFEKKLKDGTILAAAPVGYLNTTISGVKTVIIDPERGYKVRQLFQQYASDVISIRDMVEYAKSIGLKYKNGNYLSRSQIHNILHNPFYYGYMRVKGKLYPHIYEPLITKDLFNRCNKISIKRHGQTQAKAKKKFLLSGIVRCAHCGNLFSPYLSKGKYPFLQPPTNKSCVHHNISVRLVMDVLYNIFKSLHLGDELPDVIRLINDKKQMELSNRDKILLELNEMELKITDKKNRLLDLYLSRGIEEGEYKRVTTELDNEQSTISNRRLNLDDSISTFYDNLARMIKIADSCYFLIKSSRFSQKRQIIKLLTSNCLVDGKNVVITIKKPFAQMLETKGCLSWLGATCSYRHETPDEFTTITRLCKFFLKDYANAPYGVKQPGNNVFLQTKSK